MNFNSKFVSTVGNLEKISAICRLELLWAIFRYFAIYSRFGRGKISEFYMFEMIGYCGEDMWTVPYVFGLAQPTEFSNFFNISIRCISLLSSRLRSVVVPSIFFTSLFL